MCVRVYLCVYMYRVQETDDDNRLDPGRTPRSGALNHIYIHTHTHLSIYIYIIIISYISIIYTHTHIYLYIYIYIYLYSGCRID